MSSPKFVFADVDGVLNNMARFERILDRLPKTMGLNVMDKGNLFALEHIIKNTQAQIVVSSSWRRRNNVAALRDIFNYYGFKYTSNIIDVTPILFLKGAHIPRGSEIRKWLSDNNYNEYATKHVIIDDVPDMLMNQARVFVQTDPYDGLTKELADKAIAILNEN